MGADWQAGCRHFPGLTEDSDFKRFDVRTSVVRHRILVRDPEA